MQLARTTFLVFSDSPCHGESENTRNVALASYKKENENFTELEVFSDSPCHGESENTRNVALASSKKIFF